MNIQQIEETLTIPDTSLRCQRVLDEVQPILRQILDEFKEKYAVQSPDLMEYQVNTYEVTLRTTMHDARNPKYAEKKQDSDIGKKAWIELAEKRLFQTEASMLQLQLHGVERKFKIILPTNFYPLWEAIRTKGNEKEFEQVILSLHEDVLIQSSDNDKIFHKDELIPYLQTCKDEKKRPWISFGVFLDFDNLPASAILLDAIWTTWIRLEPIRNYIQNEAATHALSLRILEQLNQYQDDIMLSLYGRTYVIQFEDIYKSRPNQRRQKYAIYEKGQLLTDGMIENYLREPNEAIGVFVNRSGLIFSNIRALHGNGQIEWRITKSFKHHKKNSEDKNKMFQSRAMEALSEHGFALEGTTFTAGTWDNDNLQFIEPISEIKKKLITAAVLFADSSGLITLPKEDKHSKSTQFNRDGEVNGIENSLEENVFEHNFDLSIILNTIQESNLTFDDAIVRDFHLNLISLEDKHFVILNGISGTGKTQLCLLYANAVYGKPVDSINPYLKVISVRPDWTDSTALFGYYSTLEKRYIRPPFLNALMQATEEGKPMFVVLDEMNLARVEYYLSDYLSAVESRQPIQLHTEEHVEDVPQEIHIPNNLYVIGTINVDETTHGISDKVLDRAFVMTLSDVNLDQFWNSIHSKYTKALQTEWPLIQEIHIELSHYDLHFGYRTMNEMIRKLYANSQLQFNIRMDSMEAIDRLISEKVLPKIRGDESITPLLDKLIKWTEKNFGEKSNSNKYLKRMKGELDRYGAAQFWR